MRINILIKLRYYCLIEVEKSNLKPLQAEGG